MMSKRVLAPFLLAALLGIATSFSITSARGRAGSIGKSIGDFSQIDPRTQQRVSLADFKAKKAIAVVFIGMDCPINNAYMPQLAELSRRYSARGVQFLAINSNSQDTAEEVAAHARKYEIPFPVLKDEENRIADQFSAERTPEVFLLDAARVIRYQGRIDDQIGVGYNRPQPTRRDLAEAIDEVLADRKVSQPSVAASGCRIGRLRKPQTTGTVTFTKQVSRILQNNCQECHRPGQIGPMSLMNYNDVAAWADTIREVVEDGRMPPWYADAKIGAFSNDRHLPAEDRETLLAWIKQGCPKGDDKDMPRARQFAQGWTIGKPDLVLDMGKDFVVPATAPKTGVPYQYFRVPTNFEEDKWVVRAEARPGVASVVHHILVYIVAPGEQFIPGGPGRVLCGVAPGDTALVLPAGVAKRIPKGADLVFQMHYTPNGVAQKDRSSVGLIFTKTAPERETHTLSIANPTFQIPAGAGNHQVESVFTFKKDGLILGFMPHMHLRGKDFRYEVFHPDGKRETLLWVPRYNFGWQGSYRLAKPYPMPKGSKIVCIAHFDNSDKNPNNPDPTQTVTWGDQTWEEMMIGWTEIVFDEKPR